MSKVINITHRWSGRILFTFEHKDNSIALTIEAAISSGADLSGANLRDADLRDANIDFSKGWTFACWHSRFKISIDFAYQVLAHLCSCTSDDAEFQVIREKILSEARKSHRADDLGLMTDSI